MENSGSAPDAQATRADASHPSWPASELISLAEIQTLFDCAETTLLALLRSGQLPGVKLGHEWRIPRQAFWVRMNQAALERAEERRRAETIELPPPPPELAPRTRGRPRHPY